jgi:hypothetical protein
MTHRNAFGIYLCNRGSILVNDLLDVRKNGGFVWIAKLDDFLPCLWVISECCGDTTANTAVNVKKPQW